jgi:hypothetical protein
MGHDGAAEEVVIVIVRLQQFVAELIDRGELQLKVSSRVRRT